MAGSSPAGCRICCGAARRTRSCIGVASQDKLRDPAVLRAQVKRMIADPKAWEFVRSFAGQWLSVRNFDNGTPPNRDFYRDYDDALARQLEAGAAGVFQRGAEAGSARSPDFLDSDFLVINERLAKHYGIDGVEGDNFRRVPAPADDRRGGVLGMAGILTYLADGTRTLPVRRATWVLDTLWNQPVPPPPPNAGNLAGQQGQEAPQRPRTPRRASHLGKLRELPRPGRSLRHGAGKLRRHRHVARAPERRRHAEATKVRPRST